MNKGASGKPDRAVVNGAASVSALRASVPSADLRLVWSGKWGRWHCRSADGRMMGYCDDILRAGIFLPAEWAGWDDGSNRTVTLFDAQNDLLARADQARADYGLASELCRSFAQAIEARRAETGTGSVHESAVAESDAPALDQSDA